VARLMATDVLFPFSPSRSSAASSTGSLLSMVESRVLMVAEVLRHDQTLTRKSGSRPT
jgi:hypothetical protein